jgi:tripartite-type tricarboxylate transporter receptor subunit TctC
MALFNSMTNTKMIHVPYKGGGPAAIAIASGEVQAMAATIGSVITHIESGRLRPLGVTSDQRVRQYPDVPTIAESGVKGYEFTAWIGAFAPAGTPRAIVDRLNAELKKVLAQTDVAKTLSSQTLDPLHMTPEQFEQRLKSDYAKYEKLIRMTGATVD